MTIDKQEIKALADLVKTDRRFCADEYHHALADGVLALLAEISRIEIDAVYVMAGSRTMPEVIDQLKAENEALRKIISESSAACGAAVSVECSLEFMADLPSEIGAVLTALRKDAERYRWLASPAVYNGTLGIADGWIDFECKIEAQQQIDAAMAKEVSHD